MFEVIANVIGAAVWAAINFVVEFVNSHIMKFVTPISNKYPLLKYIYFSLLGVLISYLLLWKAPNAFSSQAAQIVSQVAALLLLGLLARRAGKAIQIEKPGISKYFNFLSGILFGGVLILISRLIPSV